MADVLAKLQLNDRAPGGSKNGIIDTRNNRVIGVVFHINLLKNRRDGIVRDVHTARMNEWKLKLIESDSHTLKQSSFLVAAY